MIHYQKKTYVCYLDLSMDILRKKWKAVILCHLNERPTRFLELQRKTATISQKVLTESLKELEKEGFLSKQIYAEVPLKVEYSLTKKGEEITTILLLIEKWGEKYYKNQSIKD